MTPLKKQGVNLAVIETARKLLAILTPKERRRGVLVIVLMMGVAVVEVAGIASVMPFLSVLGNPEIVEENRYLRTLYEQLYFTDTQSFVLALGIAAVIILVTSSVFRALAHYATLRFVNMRRHSISRRLLASHLRQPYEFFLSRNTAELSKTILSEVDQFTNYVAKPVID